MKKNIQKILSSVLVGLVITAALPIRTVSASSDLNIIGQTKVTVKAAQQWAEGKDATDTFVNLADDFWNLAESHGGVNPSIAYIQSAIETGYGKYPGQVPESYKNTCGLKTRDGSGFAQFNTWEDGIGAHLDHLALYAGATGYPNPNTKDPRHFSYLLGTATTVNAMGKSWSMSDTYAPKILEYFWEMRALVKDDIISVTSDTNLSENNSELSGYIFSQNPISSVDILVDGNLQNTLTELNPSPNVASIYSNYYNAETGAFSVPIGLSGLNTTATIKLVVHHTYGEDTSKSFTVNVEATKPKLENRICIDSPKSSIELDDVSKLRVRGWALSDSGVKKVQVYIDGKLNTTIPVNASRVDVYNVYPQYNTKTAGYDAIIELGAYRSTMNVKIVAVSNDGSTFEANRKVTLPSKSKFMCLDYPKSGTYSSSTTQTFKVQGWALGDSKVTGVECTIGGVRIGSVTYGSAREDVYRAYSDYNNHNAGFSGTVSMNRIPRGSSPMVVTVHYADGSSVSKTTILTVTKKANRMFIDNPSTSSQIGNSTLVRGWALNDSGVHNVRVYVNGVYKATADYGVSRPDVNRVYPGYSSGDNAGYQVDLDTSYLADGIHEIKVIATGNDGSSTTVTRTVRKGVEPKNKTIMIDPGHGGSDSGAVATHNGVTYYEKTLNLEISRYLKEELEAVGYTVAMTRNSDIYVGLEERSTMANNRNVDYFISIHQDSFTSSTANGTTAFYTTKVPDKGYWSKDKNYKFTKSMATGQDIVNGISNSLSLYNRGLKDQSLSVTRNTDMPSNLIECGFITNSLDIKKISLDANQKMIAHEIAKGIEANF